MECEHKEEYTCSDCGKVFCRICNPPVGIGQVCFPCYKKKMPQEKVPQEEKKREIKLPQFPITLTEKDRLDELPPFKTVWYKFFGLLLAGTAAWTLITALVGQRNTLTSLGVAVLLACGMVWSLGFKNDVRVGILAVMITVLSLVLGEVIVQTLFRLNIIKELDTLKISVYSLTYPSPVYTDILFKVFFYRLLPSAAVAFLIGSWPLPKKLSWRGFKRSEEKAGSPLNGKAQKVFALFFLVMMFLGAGCGNSQSSGNLTKEEIEEQKATITEYYEFVGKMEYEKAYDMTSENYQNGVSFPNFKYQYENFIEKIKVNSMNMLEEFNEADTGVYNVTFDATYKKDYPFGDGKLPALHVVAQKDGSWKIDSIGVDIDGQL
jgi:hypothetical protein